MARRRLTANTGALFPRKSETRPCTVPPDKTHKHDELEAGNVNRNRPLLTYVILIF